MSQAATTETEYMAATHEMTETQETTETATT